MESRRWDEVFEEWVPGPEVTDEEEVETPLFDGCWPWDLPVRRWQRDRWSAPHHPGVYAIVSPYGVLYVGATEDLVRRLRQVIQAKWWPRGHDDLGLAYRELAVSELASWERRLIATYEPALNIQGRSSEYTPHWAWDRRSDPDASRILERLARALAEDPAIRRERNARMQASADAALQTLYEKLGIAFVEGSR